MPREVVVQLWCDLCWHQDNDKRQGEEIPAVTIDGSKPRSLVLCSDHMPIFVDLASALESHGEAVEVTPKATCLYCGSEFKDRRLLSGHLRRVHQSTISEMEGKPKHGNAKEDGPKAALALPVAPTDETTVTCPECGEKFSGHRAYQAIGVHRSRKHGVKGQGKKKYRDSPVG